MGHKLTTTLTAQRLDIRTPSVLAVTVPTELPGATKPLTVPKPFYNAVPTRLVNKCGLSVRSRWGSIVRTKNLVITQNLILGPEVFDNKITLVRLTCHDLFLRDI